MASRLERIFGKENAPLKRFRAAIHEDEKKKDSLAFRPWLFLAPQVPGPDELRRMGLNKVYVLLEMNWAAASDRMLDDLKQDARYRLIERRSYKCLSIYKFSFV